MVYFKRTFTTSKGAKELNVALCSLLETDCNTIFVFPFALFSSSYYKYVKRNWRRHYTGKVDGNKFRLTNFYFSLRFGVQIDGEYFNEGKVKLEFKLSDFETIIYGLAILAVVLYSILESRFDLLATLLLLHAIILTILLINYLRIRNRLK